MKKMRIVSFIAALALLLSMFVLPATASAAPAPPLTNVIIEGVFLTNDVNYSFHPRQDAFDQRLVLSNTGGITIVRPREEWRDQYNYLVICIKVVGTASDATPDRLNGENRVNKVLTERLNSYGQTLRPGEMQQQHRENIFFEMPYYTGEDDYFTTSYYGGVAPFNTINKALWIRWE